MMIKTLYNNIYNVDFCIDLMNDWRKIHLYYHIEHLCTELMLPIPSQIIFDEIFVLQLLIAEFVLPSLLLEQVHNLISINNLFH
jgi:hypothetical protein